MAVTKRDFKAKKEAQYRTWVIWNSLPRHLSLENLQQLSVNDPMLIELAAIKTQKELAAYIGVRPSTITDWSKQPIPDEYKILDWRYWARQATPLIVAKYIDKLLIHADAPRFTAWMKYVEQIEEKTKHELTGANGEDIITGLASLVAGADKVLKDHGEDI